jgi:diketogulonate reductase-like aldo/keto reductase
MQTETLTSGNEIPVIGFGMWQLWNEAECKTAVRTALEAGYRHFDTAQFYENEKFLGDVLQKHGLPREEIFITTKIKNDNFGPDKLAPSFEQQSLKNLQTEYVDMLLLHFPVTRVRQGAWKQLEEFARAGTAKSIGVSNYTIAHLKELLASCTIKPAVNQVELHVYLQQPDLVAFCKQEGIVIEAYSPLAHGYGLDNPVLQKIGKKYGKSPAQVMLRWCVDYGTVPLPKSAHPERIKENINIFDFKLTPEDMVELGKLNEGLRTAWDPSDVA